MSFAPRQVALRFGQGALMGAADVVPGVSGGSVALIVGVYRPFIDAIRALTGVPPALLRRGPRGARERLAEVDWPVVGPLGVGIVAAVLLGAVVIPPLLERFPAGSNAAFFGLILASAALPWRRLSAPRPALVALAALAAAVSFLLTGVPALAAPDPSLLRVGASGAVAVSAMLLPGVSGAFLLAALGLYEPTLVALRDADVVYLSAFALGLLTGLALFSRVLAWLLSRHADVTMAALTGLMLGALRALWPWQGPERTLLVPAAEWATLGVAVVALATFGALTLVLRAAARRERAVEPVAGT